MPLINRVHDLVSKLDRSGASPPMLEQALADLDRTALQEDELKAWYEYWGRAAEDRGDVSLAIRPFRKAATRATNAPAHCDLPTLCRIARTAILLAHSPNAAGLA
jgi:hypothetical protein